MNTTEMNLLDWQKRYGTEEACAQALAQQRWPEGFRCPRCGHDHGYAITTRHSYECSKCHLPSLAHGWDAVSLHQPFPDPVVLGNLSGCIGQGWYFRYAAFPTNRHILDHRQTDAAQDTRGHGASR